MLLLGLLPLVAASIVHVPQDSLVNRPLCGARSIADEAEAQLKDFLDTPARHGGDRLIDIPTYFHFVSAPGSMYAIPEAEIEPYATRQIDAMNKAFAPGNIKFTLQETTYTENDIWAEGESNTWPAMGRTLRQGGYDTLNLYFCSNMAAYNEVRKTIVGTIGISAFPEVSPVPSAVLNVDGSMIWQQGLPGARYEQLNLGYTAVHEIGHWLGLWHVFANPYARPGDIATVCTLDDGISDTPLQYSATVLTTKEQGCPVGKDSCPNSPGLDNVSNFMDYSSDFCMESFTPEQFRRMRGAYEAFRQEA